MGAWNIFKKDPSFYQNLMIQADKKLAYIPGISIIISSVDIVITNCIKSKIHTLSGRESINKNAYYVYLNSKKINRTFLLFIPFVGNFMVAVMDFSRHKAIQKEKKSQSSHLQFRLAKRYLTGDGVSRDLEKSQRLFNQALKDLNHFQSRSLYALQYLDHIFSALDDPYSRAINLIKGIKDKGELSKLNKICLLRAAQWKFRIDKFEASSQFVLEESKEMKTIHQGYLNAAKYCEKQQNQQEKKSVELGLSQFINIS